MSCCVRGQNFGLGLSHGLYPIHTELRHTVTMATSNRRRSQQVAAQSPFNCHLAVTPKHRSQWTAVFLHYTGNANRPTVLKTLQRLYCDCTVTWVDWRSFCGRNTDRIVAVQSQYTCATADRVQTKWSNSATMDDRTATTVRAVRAQIDSRLIALRSKSRRKEFWTAQNSSATVWRPVRLTMTTLRLYWDLTAICRDLVQKLVAVRSQPRSDWGIRNHGFSLDLKHSALA